MTSGDLTVDSIIKKYEQRQQQLSHSIANPKSEIINTVKEHEGSLKYLSSGADTPEFNRATHRKEKKSHKDAHIQKTQKKNQSYQSFNPRDAHNSEFHPQETSKKDYEMLLSRLGQSEDNLVRSEKNYAEIWKKYELLLKEGKRSGKQVEIEHKLRGKEVAQLQQRMDSYEREVSILKECISAKDGNLSALREKLKEKNERIVEAERLIEGVKVELEMFRAKQTRLQEEQEDRKGQRDGTIDQLHRQMGKFEGVLEEKEKEKRNLLMELQKNYLSHREELQILRLTYKKVEDEYKQWIENCGSEKMQLIQQYQQKLKQSQQTISALSSNSCGQHQMEEQLKARNKEISHLMDQNSQLVHQLKTTTMDGESGDRIKQELIIKVSTLENNMIQKINYQRLQEESYTKLQALYRNEEEKNKKLTKKYSAMNNEFQQLKNKCAAMFTELEERKGSKDSQTLESIRLKKEIMTCRELLEKYRGNQMSLTHKLNDSVSLLRTKNCQFEEEKLELTTELLAQRLQNAQLKDELQQTKVQLKKEYDLSLENTKRELELKITSTLMKPLAIGSSDVSKEQMYLQMRQLERRYELLASEIVTVDEVVGMASKAQRRYQLVK